MEKSKVTILGCGSSEGVPSVETGYGACNSNNPYNNRLRTSIFIQHKNTNILVDTGPDLRQQLLTNSIKNITNVIYTHAHQDHVSGIDELRAINRIMKKPIDCYMDKTTQDIITHNFSYAFGLTKELVKERGIFAPWLNVRQIKKDESFKINDLDIYVTEQCHGYSKSLGFVFNKKFAYLTDFKVLDESNHHFYENLDTLIVASGTLNPHPCHSCFSETVELVKKLKPKQAYLTHLNNRQDYDFMVKELKGLKIMPCYDGLTIPIKL